MKKLKTTIYIEVEMSSPFQIEWKQVKKELPFIPYPGLLIKDDEKLLSVINCVYDLEKGTVEVYTKQQNLTSTLPPSVVN